MVGGNYGVFSKHVEWMFMIINNILENIYKERLQLLK
jgi:hypothetical protein